MLKKIIQFKLKILADLTLKKYKPKIVAITGSFGKTSTKEAVYAVLKEKFKIRQSFKNYNNELGVPLTILGQESAGKNIFKWIIIFLQACAGLLFKKDYPEILVLEIAADKPGDIQYLTQFIKPDLVILTGIGTSHLEFFKNRESLAKEKLELLKALKKDGAVILDPKNIVNIKDLEINENRIILNKKTERTLFTYGFSDKTELQGFDFKYNSLANGINFKTKWNNEVSDITLPKVHSFHQTSSALAGIACGLVFKMNLKQTADGVRNFDSPLGRMNLIAGIKNSWILDDTYNASPESTCSALTALKALAFDRRKVFIFGDMLELGTYTEEGHRKVGKKALESGADLFLTIGDRANFASDEARKNGMDPEKIKEFDRQSEILPILEKYIKPNDLILVKGSQGARMEKVVEDIMADPMNAKNILVRQDKEWIKK